MSLFNRKPKEQPRIAYLAGDGTFSLEIVGESHYRDALIDLTRRGAPEERHRGEVKTAAVLRKEPTNKFDPMAVGCYIEGQLVGYISRMQCADIHDVMAAAAKEGYSDQMVACDAMIGWNANNPNPPIGVRLDLVWSFGDEDGD